MANFLVVYFSETGNTRYVANRIADYADADLEELKELDPKSPFRVFKTILGMKTKVSKAYRDPNDYDIIFLGSPVWAMSLVPALRGYLSDNPLVSKKLALFCTMNSMGSDRVFRGMRGATKKCRILGELAVKEDELGFQAVVDDRIEEWVNSVRSRPQELIPL